MPTEEVFTSPDAGAPKERSARQAVPSLGQIVRGLELTFEGGRAVRVEAETGAELVRSHFATIENADRLGEVALVTKESRVGQTGMLFYDTLFDENATCHIAYGAGFPSSSTPSPTTHSTSRTRTWTSWSAGRSSRWMRCSRTEPRCR